MAATPANLDKGIQVLSRFAVPMLAWVILFCATNFAWADACRHRLPDGRMVLTLPPPGIPCAGKHPMPPKQFTHFGPAPAANPANPSMHFTTGNIGPFTTGPIGPATTFSNTIPAHRQGR
jgi:hypothetical protein